MREQQEEFMQSHGTVVRVDDTYQMKTYAQIVRFPLAQGRSHSRFDQCMVACLAAVVLLCLYLVYTKDISPHINPVPTTPPLDHIFIETLVFPRRTPSPLDDAALSPPSAPSGQSNGSSFRDQYEQQLQIYNRMMSQIKSMPEQGGLAFQLPEVTSPN